MQITQSYQMIVSEMIENYFEVQKPTECMHIHVHAHKHLSKKVAFLISTHSFTFITAMHIILIITNIVV